jgi:hypothetical protein
VYLCELLTSSKQRQFGGIPEEPHFLLLDESFPMLGMKNDRKVAPGVVLIPSLVRAAGLWKRYSWEYRD